MTARDFSCTTFAVIGLVLFLFERFVAMGGPIQTTDPFVWMTFFVGISAIKGH